MLLMASQIKMKISQLWDGLTHKYKYLAGIHESQIINTTDYADTAYLLR